MHRSVLALAAKSLAGLGIAALVLSTSVTATAPVSTASAASSDYFLKIEGVDGESTREDHKNEIEILSWSWGASNAGSMAAGSGGGSGKVSFQDLSFTKRIDKSTPLIAQACASGKHFPKATLTVPARLGGGSGDPINDDNGGEYRITLTDVSCTSIKQSGDASSLPSESISLNYTKIEWTYMAKNADGTSSAIKGSWNLKENVK